MRSTVWTAQRCSWSYTEKRREEGGRRQRWPGGYKGGMKIRETDPVSNQFLKCPPPSGIHRDSESWIEKRRGREQTEVTWWRERRFQRGIEQSSQ